MHFTLLKQVDSATAQAFGVDHRLQAEYAVGVRYLFLVTMMLGLHNP